ncbi:hypothetical protein [Bacteroides xylanisolvens]|nr:hypothetical protein [Bacteroides xylanisolvens]
MTLKKRGRGGVWGGREVGVKWGEVGWLLVGEILLGNGDAIRRK